MNARERILAILLGCVIILGGAGFFGYQFVYVPWSKKSKDLKNLGDEFTKKTLRIAEIEGHRAELARWRMLSLPAESDVAQREYVKYLNDLLVRHGVAPERAMVSAKPLDKQMAAGPGAAKDKEPIYQKLTFNVAADLTMPSLVGVLEDFYKTGILHEVKELAIQRQVTNTDPTRANELTVHLRIEALIVTGADKRSYVLPNIDRRLLAADLAATFQHGPAGLGLVLWAAGPTGPAGPGLLASKRPTSTPSGEAVADMFFDTPRNYESIAYKNVFLGRPPVEARETAGPPEWMAPRYVHLTGISTDYIGKTTATLYDVSSNRFYKLRATSGLNQFPFIKDGDFRTVVRGNLVKVDDRDVTFRAEIAGEEPSAFRGTERAGFFRLDKKEQERLIEEKVIRSEDVEHVFRAERSYWESLLKNLVVRERDSTSFRIQLERDGEKPVEAPADDEFGGGGFGRGGAIDVLQGKILHADAAEVLVRVESRYFTIHMGQSIEESLKKPLGAEQVKGLKLAAH